MSSATTSWTRTWKRRPVSRERVLLWETCDLLTAMLHAWTKVRLLRIDPRMTVLKHHLEKHSIPASDFSGAGARS